MARTPAATTYGAERGLSRFEGFSDAVFAIILTLLFVEIKVPGSPQGPQGYTDLARAMAEQWREHLALLVCYGVIGAYWLQHHYSGRIYARSDHWFGAINLLFLFAVGLVPYPVRAWCFHLGTPFEDVGAVTLVAGLAVMDERLAPDFLRQITRRYGVAALIQIVAVPVAVVAPRVGVAIALVCVAFFLVPPPRPRYTPGEEPSVGEASSG
jgi:uncharacterized membrane protein